jgi:AcrR family transcriptional regulator
MSDAPDLQALGLDHRDRQRRAVLDAASAVLAEEGLSALTVRRVAKEVGASTTVVYTLFGGKEGLLEALWIEGFDRLWTLEADAPRTPPARWLQALGEAYWRNAVEHPAYYAIVFGSAVPGFRPSAETLQHGRRTFRIVVQAVQACIDDGTYEDHGAEAMAAEMWAAVHGVVSLYLAHHLPDPDRAYELWQRIGRALGQSFRRPPSPASSSKPTNSGGGPP